jgi:hypothetical protein
MSFEAASRGQWSAGSSVFPNPSQSGNAVTYDNPAWKESSIIELCSMSGMVLRRYPVTGQKTTFVLGNQAPGAYLLRTGRQAVVIVIK